MNDAVNKKKKCLFIEKYSNIFLVTGPILTAYSFGGVSITFLMGIILVFLNFLYRKSMKLYIKTEYLPLIIYVLLTCLLSFNGLLVLDNTKNLVNAIIGQIINIMFFLIAWDNTELKSIIKYADAVGGICCIFAIIQLVMLLAGKEVPIGKIPFLKLETTWIPEIWGFRINSVFSEPSYFAIFLLPIFTYHLIKHEWKKTVFFGMFVLLSSSSLGIISMTVILLEQVTVANIGIKNKSKIILGIISIVIGLGIILNASTGLGKMLNRTIEKIEEVFYEPKGGNTMRLKGYIEFYELLPMKEKLFGVGISQLRNYYLEHGYDLSNYSNSFVLTLINSGAVGFIILIIYLISLLTRAFKNNAIPFFILMFLVLLTDSILIGYRFYWICMYIYLTKKEEN